LAFAASDRQSRPMRPSIPRPRDRRTFFRHRLVARSSPGCHAIPRLRSEWTRRLSVCPINRSRARRMTNRLERLVRRTTSMKVVRRSKPVTPRSQGGLIPFPAFSSCTCPRKVSAATWRSG